MTTVSELFSKSGEAKIENTDKRNHKKTNLFFHPIARAQGGLNMML